MMTPEGFKDIPGYNGSYAANPNGEIFSYKSGAILKSLRAGTKGEYRNVALYSRNGKAKRILVHRLILLTFVGPKPLGVECDHINRNPLDNRLDNLRWVTKGQNLRRAIRKSKYTHFRGVYPDQANVGRWRAECRGFDKKRMRSRIFISAREAAIEYDRIATELLGLYAITNQSLGFL
jgi:HNH endonuclease